MPAPLSARPLSLLIAALFAASLAACGGSDGKVPASQVAAKVNDAEISVHQINALLAKANGVTNDNAPQARKEILDRLVNQQLAVEQALSKKLDRNPDVLLSLEGARREILARAYLEQIAAATPKPGDEEVKRYYDEHPDLFARRRVYALQELAIPNTAGSLDALKSFVNSGKSLDDIVNWLKENKIPARASQGNRPAEQLPLDLLPKLAQMKEGQIAMIQSPQGTMIMRIAAAQSAPVDEATAKPRIQQFLFNERSSKAIAEEIKKLKEAARIDYVGDFAKTAGTATPTPPANAAVAEAPKEPAAPVAASSPAADAIEKGIAGLK
ncbi:MAG: peptidyl-prolyl cis-trans isomerase, EpsD family [Dechloromonas sp.]|nr:MAG: peptidyl-prolyl cis-trans isomerase, EpsD family [Dechloromonas sp.]